MYTVCTPLPPLCSFTLIYCCRSEACGSSTAQQRQQVQKSARPFTTDAPKSTVPTGNSWWPLTVLPWRNPSRSQMFPADSGSTEMAESLSRRRGPRSLEGPLRYACSLAPPPLAPEPLPDAWASAEREACLGRRMGTYTLEAQCSLR